MSTPKPQPPALRPLERLALALYSVAIRAASPLLRRKLRRRAVQEPGYAEAVPERFGCYDDAFSGAEAAKGRLSKGEIKGASLLWIHAVSLGETRTAGLLIEALRARIPNLRIVFTHGTATGREEGRKHLRSGDVQAWLPWDSPQAVERFLMHFQPRMGLLMETEVWPNLVQACAPKGIPLWLVNARLNERSLRGIQKAHVLMGPAYRHLHAVWAQTAVDAQRLASVGAPVKGITGNIKFDAEPNALQLALGQRLRAQRQQAGLGTGVKPVVVLASSREGEEQAWLEAIIATGAVHTVQWLVVPRHPQRFDAVEQLVKAHGLTVSRRSQWGEMLESHALPAADVWLGDSMGEMALYYSLAQAALLGASFEPLGGQNLIEACACGCPIIMGPHTFNFAQAASDALAQGAALRVATLSDGVKEAVQLVSDAPRLQDMQAKASTFAQAHRGALVALANPVAEAWRALDAHN